MISPFAVSPLPLVRWLTDPERLEELLGDLEELRALRTPARWWLEALSVCVRQSRLRTMPFTRVAAVVLVAGWATLASAGLSPGGEHRVVRAADRAGMFTLAFDGSRVVGASLDGEPLPANRIVQTPGRVVIRGGDGVRDLNIRLLPGGQIYWHSRPPRLTNHP